jgi:hypothetical protein
MSDSQKRNEIAPTNQPTRTEIVTTSPSTQGKPLAPLPRGGNLLDHAFNSLPTEQQEALMQKAVEAKIDIERRAAESNQSHLDFQRESVEVVQQTRELQRSGVDFAGSYDGTSASGKWHVETKKSNLTVIIAVVAIIGIVLLVVALR